MVLGSKVRFLLIVFKANLKASSSAPEGPLSMDSNIPPVGPEKKKQQYELRFKNSRAHNGRFLLL